MARTHADGLGTVNGSHTPQLIVKDLQRLSAVKGASHNQSRIRFVAAAYQGSAKLKVKIQRTKRNCLQQENFRKQMKQFCNLNSIHNTVCP